jgi:hypothetical protein
LVVSRGLLEAGVLAGYWRKKDSAAAAELGLSEFSF